MSEIQGSGVFLRGSGPQCRDTKISTGFGKEAIVFINIVSFKWCWLKPIVVGYDHRHLFNSLGCEEKVRYRIVARVERGVQKGFFGLFLFET